MAVRLPTVGSVNLIMPVDIKSLFFLGNGTQSFRSGLAVACLKTAIHIRLINLFIYLYI